MKVGHRGERSSAPKETALLLPEVPDPQPDDLKPFLGGLSPHGPTGW